MRLLVQSPLNLAALQVALIQAYIEPFVTRPIATFHIEHDVTSYYDEAGNLVAVAYFHEREFYTAEFHGTSVE